MNTNYYRSRTKVGICTWGQFDITITYRGKTYHCTSNSTLAYDRLDDDNYPDNYIIGFYSNKQAWKALYEECKRKNNLV